MIGEMPLQVGVGITIKEKLGYFWYSYLECLEWSLRTHDIIEAQINHKTNQRKVKVAYKKRNSLRVPLLIYIFNNFIEQRNDF